MVRLKETFYHLIGESLHHFNSSMVRLKDVIFRNCTFRNKFQFLNGAIKRIALVQNDELIKYFNSSMVRLKAKKPNHQTKDFNNFNSSMVRLKGDFYPHCR